MTDQVKITRINAVYDKVECDTSTAYELSDKFSFLIPNASFHPKVRNRQWDGKMRLFNLLTKTVYGGLRDQVIEYCTSVGYNVICNDDLDNNFSLVEANKFIDSLNIPEKFQRRDYQVSAFATCVRTSRALLLSPTSSGKSFMIYLLLRYFNKDRVLLIVPRTTLVEQMIGDFRDYGSTIEEEIHGVYSGREKEPLIVEITCADGNVYKFNGNENIKMINSNIYKLARDITENDEIDNRWLQLYIKKQVL